MNTLQRILLSEGFIGFAFISVLMLVLYIIARLISARAGVNDLLKTADKRIVTLMRMVRRVRVLCTAPSAENEIATDIRMLKKVIKWQKRASRMLAAYLFDDREDRDVIAAKAIVDGVPNVCRTAIVNVAEHGEEDLNRKFDDLDAEVERARALLSKAKKLDKKKELLQL
jgi:hypothetical protein